MILFTIATRHYDDHYYYYLFLLSFTYGAGRMLIFFYSLASFGKYLYNMLEIMFIIIPVEKFME